MSATISVVIPSYNHARYLPEAIASVRSQSLPVDELVVVDDGSTDGSRAVLEGLRFDRMRLEVQENRGAHAALNRAIEVCRGDWVAILNSDDVFEPTWIEQAWGVATASGAALVCGEVTLIGEDGSAAPPDHDITRWYEEARALGRTAGSIAEALSRHNVAVTTSNFFLHRSLWEALDGFRAWRWVHDYDFVLRAVALCPGRVVYEPSLRGVRYRIHGANTISEAHERALAERAEMLRGVRSLGARLRGALDSSKRRGIAKTVAAAADLGPVRGSDAGPVAGAGSGPSGVSAAAVGPATPAGPVVGLVVRSLGLGGLEEVVALLAEALPSQGLVPKVFCTHSGGEVAERLARTGVSVDIGDGSAARCAAWARGAGVEVASTHFVPVDAVRRLTESGVPVVETVHNTYAWLDDDGWASERERAGLVARLVAVSDRAAAYYARHAGRAADRVVPNAVHPGRATVVPRAFARALLGVQAATPLAVSVGRVTGQKNPEGLLRAFGRVVEELPEARLLLVGPEDRTTPVSALRSGHRHLFQGGAVRWLGPRTDVHVVMSAADVFVSASFYEGWSVAASEAAWSGLPLVLTDAGGATALVGESGERGVLVPNPFGDPLAVNEAALRAPPGPAAADSEAALAAALLDVLPGRDAWRTRSDELRGWARATLSPRAMAERYAAVFREAVDDR